MSLSADTFAVLKTANLYLYQIGGPILLFIGSAGSILNLTVFTQKNLRKNPCSIYLIAYDISNFMYIYSALLSLTLGVGYNADYTVYNLIICRLRLYATILFNVLSAFYFIFASIDRILVTSRNVRTRQRSNQRLAYTCIIGGTIFWSLFHIHALILSNITQVGPNSFLCFYQQGAHLTFVSYYALIKETSSFALMTICGLWSIKSIRSATRRIEVAFNVSVSRTAAANSSSKDRQFILMLIIDVIIYVIFSFLFAGYYLYQQITQYYIKSFDQIQIENNVRNICLYGVSVSFCTSFYTNFIVSKTFRKEVKKILLSLWKRVFCIG